MKRILISGSSGFVGTRLKTHLAAQGHKVYGLSRGVQDGDTFTWNPDSGKLPAEALCGTDVVINLAGASIADGRWTHQRKQILRESRIASTRTLVNAMVTSGQSPGVFISMSGVNYYPDGNSPRLETDGPGSTFLAKLCEEWEAEALRAQTKGIRTVILRLGVVLDKSGGALAKMLPPFRAGAGGPIGSGKQGFPWLSLEELIRIIDFAIEEPALNGPVNAVHPDHVSQAGFSRSLGKALKRPAVVPLPAFMVRLLFGQMGNEMLLGNLHVVPGMLTSAGYRFKETDLAGCLTTMFGDN